MKILKSILILSLIVATYSCSSDDDSDNQDNAAFRMDVDGETLTFDTDFVVAIMTDEGRHIGIVATDPSSMQSGTLDIGSLDNSADPLAEGTYVSSEEDGSEIGYVLDGNSFASFGEGGSGTIIITSLDTESQTISGTFNGTVTNFEGNITYDISNGVFNVDYIER